MKQITAVVIGYGNRGGVYCCYQEKAPKDFKVVGVVDRDAVKVRLCRERYEIPEDRCFSSVEELLHREKLADVAMVCTDDQDHVSQAIALMKHGYDLLLEKPVAVNLEDCLLIRDTAEELGRSVLVGHVLRYTVFFQKLKELIDSGAIGRVIQFNQIENVGYWHYAHSYVRGNWRNSQTSAPMILTKCCHELDLLNWMIGEKCERLTSFGSLSYFKEENKPEGSAERCINCTVDCPYNAYKFYYQHHFVMKSNTGWPVNVITPIPTKSSIFDALRNGPYGRCVFLCDNNVVDHQVVNMRFAGGVDATLTMSAFTAETYREVKIMGTLGEIIANMESNRIQVNLFSKKSYQIDVARLTDDFSFHAGGDHRLMADLITMMRGGKSQTLTSIEKSIESHVMAFAAEESRINGGQPVLL